MTEYWKSNPNYWCEYCKCWIKDEPAARATHERGIKHKENVALKLRAMRQNADKEKREAALAEATMSTIEAQAKKQYEKDMQAAKKAVGVWVWDEKTGYYYSESARYYFDRNTKMYYGGDPAAWTVQPDFTTEARFENAPKRGGPDDSEKATTASVAASTGPQAGDARKFSAAKHVLKDLGGYQMPSVGAIGGAKAVGSQDQQPKSAALAAKRKAEQEVTGRKKAAKPVSKEEQEALAAREAARARVQKRTMQGFGLA